MHNLLVELDERFDDAARAEAVLRIEHAGCGLEERESADDRTLACIDALFGSAWSSEAYAGANVIARRGAVPAGFATYDAKGLRYRWLRGAGAQPGIGIFGPIGVAPPERGRSVGGSLLTIALCGLRRLGFRSALIPAVGDQRLVRFYERACGARVVESFNRAELLPRRYRTLVMASGAGTTFQSIAEAAAEGALPIAIHAVVVNHAEAGVIARAHAAQIPNVEVVSWRREAESRAEYDVRLRERAASFKPELVLLLGWMHLLDASFVQRIPEIVNLHPAFLPLDPARNEVGMPDGSIIPAFRGPHAVRDAVRAGSGWIGASVHRVTRETDRGRVLVRTPLQLRTGEDEEEAYARLRPLERALVPRAIMRWAYER